MAADRQGVRMKGVLRKPMSLLDGLQLLEQGLPPGFFLGGKLSFAVEGLKRLQG